MRYRQLGRPHQLELFGLKTTAAALVCRLLGLIIPLALWLQLTVLGFGLSLAALLILGQMVAWVANYFLNFPRGRRRGINPFLFRTSLELR